MFPPKAESVTVEGQPDGFVPPRAWNAQISPDGNTRIAVSVPPEELATVHLRLLDVLAGPLGVRYVRLTDRATGQLPKPISFVRMEIPAAELRSLVTARPGLFWHDGRHQTWIRGRYGEQVVLDELGLLWCYPDDPSFRDALGGIPEASMPTMDSRDYVRVSFLASADEEERSFLAEGGLVEWRG